MAPALVLSVLVFLSVIIDEKPFFFLLLLRLLVSGFICKLDKQSSCCRREGLLLAKKFYCD